MRISCIGTGAMGSAVMRALCKKTDAKNITVSNRTSEKAQKFAEETGCNFSQTNRTAVKDADFIFIAVKPQFLKDVFSEIKDCLTPNQIIISMAAGVTIEKLESFAPGMRFIRIMPNVCAQIGESMTALACKNNIKKEELENTVHILSASGKVEQVEEKLMDCVTGVSGSGPAFAFMFIEAMADAAVKCGMPRAQAYIYAAQTVRGSATLVLESGHHPAVLKDSVCSPSGTTIEGVASLESTGFRNSVIQAVTAACNKSAALGK